MQLDSDSVTALPVSSKHSRLLNSQFLRHNKQQREAQPAYSLGCGLTDRWGGFQESSQTVSHICWRLFKQHALISNHSSWLLTTYF